MSVGEIIISIVATCVLVFLMCFGYWGFYMFDCAGGLFLGILASIFEIAILLFALRKIILKYQERKNIKKVTENEID